MDKQQRDELIAASTLAAAVQALAHWFPWHRAIGDELQPPLSYVIGCSPILGIFTTWARRHRDLTGQDAATGLIAIVGSSGIAVLLGYGLDIILGKRQEDQLRRSGRG